LTDMGLDDLFVQAKNIWQRTLFYGILEVLRIAHFSGRNTRERFQCLMDDYLCQKCINRYMLIDRDQVRREQVRGKKRAMKETGGVGPMPAIYSAFLYTPPR